MFTQARQDGKKAGNFCLVLRLFEMKIKKSKKIKKISIFFKKGIDKRGQKWYYIKAVRETDCEGH